jgi:hypothetical protein
MEEPRAMMLFGLLVALACLCVALLLAIRASRALWANSGWVIARTPWGSRTHAGLALAASDETVTAPFSGRPALWVRARVIGPPPEGGPPRVLWSRVISAPSVVRTRNGRASIDWEKTTVIARVEYRRGTEKVLEREAPVLSRVLSRAGYKERPKGATFFELEEEILAPNARVIVRGELSESFEPVATEANVIVSTLDPLRLVARQSWGPVLALWFALLATAAGGGVLVAAWWLRRGG